MDRTTDLEPARDDRAAPADLLHPLVDALDFGVLVLAPCGRVHWANRPARDALAAGDALRVEDGRLALHGPRQQRELMRALADAAAGASRMLCLGGGVPTTKLALSRWCTDAGGTTLMLGTLQTGERTDWPALDAYARERRLTAGEADVLQMLVLGDRPPQIAARRGSSEGTVRSQIKTLLEKTGTHSMRELVVEVLHLPPMPVVPGTAAMRVRGDAPPRGEPRRRVSERDVPAERGVAPLAPREAVPPRAVGASPRPARASVACVRRPAPTLDRAALIALRASQFAWPPAA
ncbi:MAG: LuxR C-terminal-related transcriptional regulator [Burkholderiaceae bacterium]|jgi:DNA-binding CsgD family transcriptional regulator|nr:LuxR C-terminal-related transcriptional regulator [Burkholderiaceae bacterium]